MSNDKDYPPFYVVTVTTDDGTVAQRVNKSNMTTHLAHLGLDPHEDRTHRFSRFVRDNGSGFIMSDTAYITVTVSA